MRKNTLMRIVGGVRSAIILLSLLVIAALGLIPALPGSVANADDIAPSAVSEAYGKLPLSFEANRGQTDAQVKFLSRGPGHTLFLTSTEAVLVLTTRESPAREPAVHGKPARRGPGTDAVLRMTFVGAQPPLRPVGREELPGRANYFIGKDPAKWRTNVPTYAKVQYAALYPGIDLIYYGNQRQLEYDFVVRPGADPGLIALGFRGADKLDVDDQGNLVLDTAVGNIRMRKPVIYQEVNGVRREVAGSYVLTGTHQVGFRIAAYDASQPLVIDPVLSYSTYLGGSNTDQGLGIAVDTSGNAYVTGRTQSTNFPTTAGAFQTTGGGTEDAFVTQLIPMGTVLVYSTYLGGSGIDDGLGIAVDALGNAYVTGVTFSTNFPTTAGAFQTTLGGTEDAFVTTLNATGSLLVYSTYLGGSDFDEGFGIAVDALRNAYVTGFTGSTNFPTTAGAFQTTGGDTVDAFVTKLRSEDRRVGYSTYLRGSGVDDGLGIAVDALRNAYVTGFTGSTNVPTTAGAFQTTFGGTEDAFVTKLNPMGTGLVYSTYLGGSGVDDGFGIAVDALGNAYVTGATLSTNFPTTAGAFQTTLGGTEDT